MDTSVYEKRVDALGRGARSRLARHIGLDTSTLTKVFNGKRQLKLGEPDLIEEWLRQAETGGTKESFVPPGMVSVYGYVAAEGETLSLNQTDILRAVPMHPAQAGYQKVGAAEVIGESMYPRYKARELVYFVFGMTPKRGDDAVIELEDGRGILKEYVMRKDGHVHLKEWFPQERVFSLQETKVKHVHAIVGRG